MWIKESDKEEQSWKKGLFGNPKPIGANSVSWSFWARRPRLVESMLNKTFEKNKGVVFYGCVENEVQKSNRTRYDWSKACDEFVMSDKATFSEQEYLDKLSEARYGLCLAGYGKKCHREVECMALGTVPIVSSEVDMDNYASKPIEGVHYLRVSSPEDLLNKVKGVKNWLEMSEACKKWFLENSSVDGMWQLTKKFVLCRRMPKWKVWTYSILVVLFIYFIYFIAANVYNVKTINNRYGMGTDISFLKI